MEAWKGSCLLIAGFDHTIAMVIEIDKLHQSCYSMYNTYHDIRDNYKNMIIIVPKPNTKKAMGDAVYIFHI